MLKHCLLASTFLALMLGFASEVSAGLSANAGYTSEYYYRGILQKTSSASAGLDYENGDFSMGTWAADVGDGLEVDLYGSYGFKLSEEASLSVGATAYLYTGLFDDTYKEINLGFSWSVLSLEVSFGQYSGAPDDDNEYAFIGLTYERNGLYATYGTFDEAFEGDYLEFGYGTSLKDFDLNIALILGSEELSDQADGTGAAREGQALVFTITKNFEL